MNSVLVYVIRLNALTEYGEVLKSVCWEDL